MRDLPTGTVTFLFSDVEGSTKLLHELGAEAFAEALAEHRRVLREAFSGHGGIEVDTQGDAFFIAFADAGEALAAAAEAQSSLASGPIRVRMGLHTGTPHLGAEGYIGPDVHKGARIAAAGHGGQVLVSRETRESVAGESVSPSRPELTDLGEHRLKDFAQAVSIFQLGSERFPPLKTISNTNLPRPASSFVGREREVGEIGALLTGGARLLTLTGPGGTGKSRLSIEAASELVPEFKAGVFWVGLAALRDPALVSETIGQTLGAKNGLAAHIGEREMLLLLDNLEQVVEAAPDLAALVEACPNLRLLTTSRELLRVRGEFEYPVLPLAQPEAVDLFCARAGLAPDATIAEVCRRLDNLPLALELAAARASVLSPKQILDRLSQRLDLLKGGRDAEARQQTLRATIEWSYELLGPEEKTLFARLAVFRGACTLEAAEEVTEADLDTLQSLVNKSLLRHMEDRFAMLETIREYAVERLEASGEAEEFRRAHAEWFLALAEEAEPEVKRGSPKQWLDRLEAAGETQLLLQLAGALWWFWQVRGHFDEARRRLERALVADETPTALRARALVGAALLADQAGRVGVARLHAEEALHLSLELGDPWGAAYARYALGAVASLERDWTRARDIWEESRQAFLELGDDHFALVLTRSVSWMCEELGDIERSRTLTEEYLGRARALGNERVMARGLGALAMLAVAEGRLEDARTMMEESYRIDHELGFSVFIGVDLVRFAAVLAREGKPAAAAQLVSRADRLYEEIGTARESWAAQERDGTLAIIRSELDDAGLAEALAQGRELTLDEAVALASADSGSGK